MLWQPMRWLAAGLAIVALLVGADTALAIFAPAPIEVLIDEADLVIAGRVTGVAAAGFARHNRPQDIATIEVLRVLKSLPGHGQPKQVKLAQPAAGGLAVSTDLSYSVGEQGIWLLRRDEANKVYVVNHPSQFQQADQWKTLSALVAAREKIVGGEPVGGLIARSDLITTRPQPGQIFYEVRLSLKNTTDKPITICTYLGNQPIKVDWIGPDGAPQQSTHYKWLERARLAGVQATNFQTIPPGGIRYVGPNSPESGVFFQPAPGRQTDAVNTALAGEHRVTLSFVNNETGKQLGQEKVWTGAIVAPPVSFTAP